MAKTPQEKLAKLLDYGVPSKVITRLSEAKDEEELMGLLKKHDVPIDALLSLNQTSMEEYEEMFFRCIIPEHPMEREEAIKLLDQAEAEYGWEALAEALEVMSDQGFTLNTAGKKKILWVEQSRKNSGLPSK